MDPEVLNKALKRDGTIMKKQLKEMLEDRKDEMIQIRRYLHENPELSF